MTENVLISEPEMAGVVCRLEQGFKLAFIAILCD